MSNTAETSVVVDIYAPSGHTIMAQSQAAVRESVKHYLAGMVTGLGIPAVPELRWQTRPPGDNTIGASVQGTPPACGTAPPKATEPNLPMWQSPCAKTSCATAIF